MRPVWFPVDEIPFAQMWEDGAHWLPRILAGQPILARFVFRADNETIRELEIHPWDGRERGGAEGPP